MGECELYRTCVADWCGDIVPVADAEAATIRGRGPVRVVDQAGACWSRVPRTKPDEAHDLATADRVNDMASVSM